MRTDPPRDHVELEFARWAMADGKPLLGVCRGMQVVNVAAGGKLVRKIAVSTGFFASRNTTLRVPARCSGSPRVACAGGGSAPEPAARTDSSS